MAGVYESREVDAGVGWDGVTVERMAYEMGLQVVDGWAAPDRVWMRVDANWVTARLQSDSRLVTCPPGNRAKAMPESKGPGSLAAEPLASLRTAAPQAAASTRCRAHWPQISESAFTSRSMSSSLCTWLGVIRIRSVPTGTGG